MQPEEIIDVLKEVVLYDKSGHQCHRKRFVSAIEILSSKTKHGVQDKDTASQCTTPMSSVSHKYVTTYKYIYFNMFCLSDIKNKDNFGRTVGPAPAKDLWIPNPGKPMNSNFTTTNWMDNSHTTIITNCNLLTAVTFPPKVMQSNNARENARACDVTKIIIQVAESSTSLWRMVLKKSLK